MTTLTPEPDSRLEQLVAQYDTAKDAFDAAKGRLDTLVDGIKVEAITAAAGETKITIESPYLRKPLNLSHSAPWRVDVKRMKAEDPLTYVRWAKRDEKGSWKLERVR